MGLSDKNWDRLLQIALVGGIVFLAYNNMDGWGWLVFALLCTL
jgi:hypothetical protein